MLPYSWEVLREKSRVEYRDEEGCSSLRKVLQSPVRYTVWIRRLADLETPDGILNRRGVG